MRCRYPAYGALYTLLEVLALPAVPLTMTAGLLFGVGPGAAVVSVSATVAATISFLIARYAGVPALLSYGTHKHRSHTAGYWCRVLLLHREPCCKYREWPGPKMVLAHEVLAQLPVQSEEDMVRVACAITVG